MTDRIHPGKMTMEPQKDGDLVSDDFFFQGENFQVELPGIHFPGLVLGCPWYLVNGL